jgi:hypothetical protein
MVFWGVANMGQQLPAEQLQQLLAWLLSKVSTAKPQEISIVFWGVATMGLQLPAEQLQQLLAGFIDKLGTAAPKGVANVIWGVATMGQQVSSNQLQQLLGALAGKLPSASPQDMAMTMWGVARLQPQPFFPAPLLEPEAKQAIIRMVPAMIPQNLANIAWACGIWGYGDEQLLLPLFNRARDTFLLLRGSSRREAGASVQNLANMCWAAAVLNMQQLVSHVEQFAAAISSRWEDVVAEEKLQLYQVHMWLLDLDRSSKGLLGCLSEEQLQECGDQWQKQIGEIAASAKTSPAHQAVYSAAAEMSGLRDPPQLEGLTKDGLHSIDVRVVTIAGSKIAIEVDGPQHFRQPDLLPTGTTQWRNRSLAARGYVVVSVPPWEWSGLRAAERVGYLEGKIQQGLAGVSGGLVPDAGAAPLAFPPSPSSNIRCRSRCSSTGSGSNDGFHTAGTEAASSTALAASSGNMSGRESLKPPPPAPAHAAMTNHCPATAAPLHPLLHDQSALFARLDKMSMSGLREVAAAVSGSGLVKVVTSGPGRTKAVVRAEIRELLGKGLHGGSGE